MDKGTTLIAAGLLLILIPFIPGTGLLSLVTDPHYITTYPPEDVLQPGWQQYDIYIGRNEDNQQKYYVDPYYSTLYEFNYVSEAKAFIDDLNQGTGGQTGHLLFKVYDLQGEAISSATVEVGGLGNKETGGSGIAIWIDLDLGSYSYTVSKTGYITENGQVALTEHGTKEVFVALNGGGNGDPPPPPPGDDVLVVFIRASEGGSVEPSGMTQVKKNEVVAIVATPDNGYVFEHWTINGEVIEAEATLNRAFSADSEVAAAFKSQSYIPVGYLMVGTGIICLLGGIYTVKSRRR